MSLDYNHKSKPVLLKFYRYAPTLFLIYLFFCYLMFLVRWDILSNNRKNNSNIVDGKEGVIFDLSLEPRLPIDVIMLRHLQFNVWEISNLDYNNR